MSCAIPLALIMLWPGKLHGKYGEYVCCVSMQSELANRRAQQNTFVRQLGDMSRTLRSMGLYHLVQVLSASSQLFGRFSDSHAILNTMSRPWLTAVAESPPFAISSTSQANNISKSSNDAMLSYSMAHAYGIAESTNAGSCPVPS